MDDIIIRSVCRNRSFNPESPRFLKAEKYARKALQAFLYKPTASLHGILLKLQVACDCEDYLADTLDPVCTVVAPHAVLAATNDLEAIVMCSE